MLYKHGICVLQYGLWFYHHWHQHKKKLTHLEYEGTSAPSTTTSLITWPKLLCFATCRIIKKSMCGPAFQIIASWFNRCIKGAHCISKEEQMMISGKISMHPASSNFKRADDDDAQNSPHCSFSKCQCILSFSSHFFLTFNLFNNENLLSSFDKYGYEYEYPLQKQICVPLAYTVTNIFGGYL